MFDFLKKHANASPIEQLRQHLKKMAYELTDDGQQLAQQKLNEGLDPVSLSVRIAYTTMAYDLSQTGAAATALLRFRPQAADILNILQEYKQHDLLSEADWQEAQALIIAISAINEQQEATVKKVLSDPMFGGQRLARSISH